MRRPRLLDLFCGVGGAAKGYAEAGFDVVGVDLTPQPRFPYAFLLADALTFDPRFLAYFDAIHASPPCQAHTALRTAPGAKAHTSLISATRERLSATGRPFVIENVPGAPLIDPCLVCGSVFRLGAAGLQLRRHRLFETNWPLEAPDCAHSGGVIGVYGGHVRCRAASLGGRATADFVGLDKLTLAREAMGMDWGNMAELSQAIPPPYTRWVGRQLMELVA